MKKKVIQVKNSVMNLKQEKKTLEILLGVVFLVQFLILAYFNVKLLGNHMADDSSWSYLKAALMWKEKSFNSNVWVDQTSLFLDSSMLVASLLYGITGKLLASYGIANMITLICILWCMNDILRRMNIDLKARLFAFNLLICPYLTNGFIILNDLGYFNDLLSGPAFYNLRVLIVLLTIREFCILHRGGKISWQGVVNLFLCVLAGMSSGIFIIVVILFPYILFQVEDMFLKNDWKVLAKLEAIYGYVGVVCIFLGKLFAKHVLHISAIDTSRTWTPISKIWTNMGATIQGFMILLGVLPVEDAGVGVLSAEGLCRVFSLLIFIIVIFSIAFAVRKIIKDITTEHGIIHFLINVVGLNFLTFGLFNVQYGSAIFEERYLISTYAVMILLVAYYIYNLNTKLVYTQCVCAGLLLAIVGDNIVSDSAYVLTTNDSWQLNEIYAVVNEEDADLIYFWGDNIRIYGRAMRTYDMNHVYKEIYNSGEYAHWGDYLYYEDNGEYTGSTLLVVPNDAAVVPENIMSQYTFIRRLDNVSIYKCEYNAIDAAAGITGERSVDYPFTSCMNVANGVFEKGSYVTNGTDGCVMWGPACPTENGTYDFVLDYEILDGTSATLEIAVDGDTVPLGNLQLDPQKKEMTVADVALTEGHILDYRVFCAGGTKIRINKITIIKNNSI